MKTMKYILMMTLLTMGLQGMGQTIVYVKKTASGSNNGTSWTNAYTNLRTALANAPSNSQVWVAEGIYYVPSGSGRGISFEITNKNLSVYGGFSNSGTQTSVGQRAPQIFKAIMSGDISQDDTVFSSSTRKTDSKRSDNAYNVVKIGLSGANSYTVTLDGFWIQDGNASSSTDGADKWGAGIYIYRNANGSGSHVVNIKNCVISNNTAGSSAAIATYLYYINNGSLTLNVQQNRIYNNIADEWAVMGLHMPGTNGTTSYGWNFVSNAVYNNISLGTNTAIMGAVCRANSDPSSGFSYNINWNTFANNTTGNDGGVICGEGSTANNVTAMIAANNIFWANTPATAFYRRSGAPPFRVGWKNAYNMAQVADSFMLADTLYHNIWGDPEFENPALNYRLSPCSKAINSGSLMIPDGNGGSYSVSNSPKDVEDNTRTMYSIIDRGAHEFFGTLSGPSSSTVNAAICPGSTYTFKGQNLNSPGIYKDTLNNMAGCDSIVTLTLTMKNSSNDTFSATICKTDSFTFNNTKYGATGYYKATFTNVNGCDSVRTLNLSVINKPQPVIVRTGASLSVNGGPFDFYQWYFNGNMINGATSSSYTPTGNGNYRVAVGKTTGSVTCNNTSADFNVGFVGVKEFTLLTGINFYPNPSSGTLTIETKQPVTVVIINMLGEIMMKENISATTTLNLQALPKGIYLIGDSGMNAVSKLILQ